MAVVQARLVITDRPRGGCGRRSAKEIFRQLWCYLICIFAEMEFPKAAIRRACCWMRLLKRENLRLRTAFVTYELLVVNEKRLREKIPQPQLNYLVRYGFPSAPTVRLEVGVPCAIHTKGQAPPDSTDQACHR